MLGSRYSPNSKIAQTYTLWSIFGPRLPSRLFGTTTLNYKRAPHTATDAAGRTLNVGSLSYGCPPHDTPKEGKEAMPNDTITSSARPPKGNWPLVKRRGRAGGEQPLESTPKTLVQLNGQPGMLPRHAASDEAKLDHEGGRRGSGWSLGPFGISDYDGPETIRFRKYATGTHVLLREIGVETGATPREVIWTKNKANL